MSRPGAEGEGSSPGGAPGNLVVPAGSAMADLTGLSLWDVRVAEAPVIVKCLERLLRELSDERSVVTSRFDSVV